MGIINKIIGRIARSRELRRYSPYTIAEYFRKQGAQVGDDCYIIPTQLGTEPYLVKIGNHVAIARNVQMMTHDGGPWVFRDEIPDIQVFGPIVIEDNCIIGQGAVIFPNVTIGKNSIVAANSVVIADVAENSIVMGVPARPFGSLQKYREKCIERWNSQRPPDCKIDEGESWWTTKHFSENRTKLKRHLLEVFADKLG